MLQKLKQSDTMAHGLALPVWLVRCDSMATTFILCMHDLHAHAYLKSIGTRAGVCCTTVFEWGTSLIYIVTVVHCIVTTEGSNSKSATVNSSVLLKWQFG